MQFSPQNSVLLVIDVQGKLAERMHDKDNLFRHLTALIRTAQILEIPVIVTEQAPEKIGETVPAIKSILKAAPVRKTSFSCCREGDFSAQLRSFKRKQVIVSGIEAHVCVYQSVYDLCVEQFHVQVVADAVSSRRSSDKDLALERMRLCGATLTSTEMLICELIEGAGHPKFREIMGLIK